MANDRARESMDKMADQLKSLPIPLNVNEKGPGGKIARWAKVERNQIGGEEIKPEGCCEMQGGRLQKVELVILNERVLTHKN